MKTFGSFVVLSLLAALLLVGCSAEARRTRDLQRAADYLKAGKYDHAELTYLNVLRRQSGHPEAHAQLGLLYHEQGRSHLAAHHLWRSRELDPTHLAVRTKLAAIMLEHGDLAGARAEATAVLDRRPQDEEAPILLVDAARTPDELQRARARLAQLPPGAAQGAPAIVALGILDFKEGRLEEAEQAFDRARKIAPTWAPAESAMAVLHLRRRDRGQADRALLRAASLSPVRSPCRLRYADFKIQAGDLAGARRVLEEMTEAATDYLPAWVLLAQIAAAEKNYHLSEQLLGKALARDPLLPEAMLFHCQLLLASGQTSKSLEEAHKMVRVYSHSPRAILQLAVVQITAGEADSAEANLGRLLHSAPDLPEPTLLLATLNLRKGERGRAIATLKALLARESQFVEGWVLLAEAFQQNGDFGEALATSRHIDRLAPGNPQIPVMQAISLRALGRYDEARDELRRARRRLPNHLAALEEGVDLALEQGRTDEATELLEEFSRHGPGSAAVHLLTARVALSRQDTDGAEAALLQALALQPELPAAYQLLSDVYLARGQQDKAVQSLSAAIQRNSADDRTRMLLGILHEQRGEYAAARDVYAAQLSANPGFVPALNNLAWLYCEHFHDLEKAHDLARRARDRAPSDPHVADTLGWVLYKQAHYGRAAYLLREAATRLQNTAAVQYHLGYALYQQGEEEEAKRALDRAVTADPHHTLAAESRLRLEILQTDPLDASRLPQLETLAASRKDDSLLLSRLGIARLQGGDYSRAEEALKSASAANRENRAAWIALARLYLKTGQMVEARTAAHTARELAPRDAETAEVLGRVARRTGEYAWAASLLQESLSRRGAAPEVLHDLAYAQFGSGRTEEARRTLAQSSSAQPQGSLLIGALPLSHLMQLVADPAAANVDQVDRLKLQTPDDPLSTTARGVSCELRHEWGAAIQHYEKALARFPQFAPARRRLALLAARLAETSAERERASSLLSKARADYPSDAEIGRALGILAYQQGDFTRAARHFKELRVEGSDNPELLFYFGMTMAKLSDPAGRRALERALDLNVRADLAHQARQILLP